MMPPDTHPLLLADRRAVREWLEDATVPGRLAFRAVVSQALGDNVSWDVEDLLARDAAIRDAWRRRERAGSLPPKPGAATREQAGELEALWSAARRALLTGAA